MKRKMKIARIILFFLVVFTMTTFVSYNTKAEEVEFKDLDVGGLKINDRDTGRPFQIPKNYVQRENEFRGVWIATVYNLNMPNTALNEESYKATYRQKLDQAQLKGFNSILFQVRGMNDTYYESDYAPFSKTVTGMEGRDPGWDIVKFLIEETHSRGMEFHAWMNPYRVETASGYNPANMHSKNFAKQRPDLVIRSTDAYILNPGEPEVRNYITNVVLELIEKYPTIDGIHFDDYFYYGGDADDAATFKRYGNGRNIGDFRRDSISELIEGLHLNLKDFNESNGTRIKFGISPSGIYMNKTATQPNGSNTNGQQHYYSHFIDTVKWVKNGWLDYITPQVYWQFQDGTAPYGEIVKWWVDVVRGTGVDLIVGHSVSSGAWHAEERAKQVEFNSMYPEVKGSIMYSHANINSPGRLEYLRDNYWTNDIPTNYQMEKLDQPEISLSGIKSGTFYKSDVNVTVTSANKVRYRVNYEDSWHNYTGNLVLDHHGKKHVYFEAYNDAGEISATKVVEVEIKKDNFNLPTIEITGTLEGQVYDGDVTIKLTADPGVRIEYYIMSGAGSIPEFIPYTGEIIVSKPGKSLVNARTILGKNTPSEVIQKDFTIKEPIYAPPTINVSGTNVGENYESAVVTVETLNPNGTQYRINGARWQDYVGPITLTEDGIYKFDARNKTNSREEVTKTINIGLNEIEPTMVDINLDGIIVDDIYKSEVTVSFDETVNGDKIFYRIWHNKSWTSYIEYTEPFKIVDNGLSAISYYVISESEIMTEEIEKYITLELDYENPSTVIRDGKPVLKEDGSVIELPTYVEKTKEVRAIWFSTVSNIDLPAMGNQTVERYKEMLVGKFDVMKANNINTAFFQVRPMNDALYYSEYAPYSRYVTGTEGENPGFDLLEFVIEVAHERGIELHAWLNPYRVSNASGSKASILNALHDDNFAKKNPDVVLEDNNGKLILNPGEILVQNYLKSIIEELVTKYNLDGIHFDDYFYSYAGTPEANDKKAYDENKLPGESLGDWRRRNVNIAVKNTSEIIREANTELNKKMKFGISPFGIWRNKKTDPTGSYSNGLQSYDSQYADSKKWVEEGWLDYITPQLYWHFDNFGSTGNPIAPFADLVDWWVDLTSKNNVDLVVGQALYRHSPGEAAKYSYDYEIIEQLRYLNNIDQVIGSSFFTYKNLEEKNEPVLKTVKYINENMWTKPVEFPWESDVDYNATPAEKVTVSFDSKGGTSISSVTINKDTKVTSPADPTKVGYKFLGWYLEDELFDFNTNITFDIILVAKWEEVVVAKEFKVEFNLGYIGDDTIPIDDQLIVEGGFVTKPNDPTRAGYKFLGWYLEDELFDYEMAVEEDLTLTAKWELEAKEKFPVLIVVIAAASLVLVAGGISIFIFIKKKK